MVLHLQTMIYILHPFLFLFLIHNHFHICTPLFFTVGASYLHVKDVCVSMSLKYLYTYILSCISPIVVCGNFLFILPPLCVIISPLCCISLPLLSALQPQYSSPHHHHTRLIVFSPLFINGFLFHSGKVFVDFLRAPNICGIVVSPEYN